MDNNATPANVGSMEGLGGCSWPARAPSAQDLRDYAQDADDHGNKWVPLPPVSLRALAAATEWRAMVFAPLDGTEIEILIRHKTWWAARKRGESGDEWQGPCRGKWLDFNGGGWGWAGHMGTPVGWRPLKTPNGKFSGPPL